MTEETNFLGYCKLCGEKINNNNIRSHFKIFHRVEEVYDTDFEWLMQD